VQLTQGPQFIATDRVRGWLAALDPADVQRGCLPVDLRPLQIAQLLCPQTMAIGDQHQGGIALALGVGLAALPGGLDKLLDLVRRQVLTLAQVGIDRPDWHCPVLVCWRHEPELGFSLHLLPPVEFIVLTIRIFRSINPVKSAQSIKLQNRAR
jgi:hypothetical protein